MEDSSGKKFSLLKFDKPELINLGRDRRGRPSYQHDSRTIGTSCGEDDGLDETLIERCKQSTTSQLETDQILSSITAPREWEEDGKRYRQLISKLPTNRSDILDLNEALNDQLTNRQARPDGICPIRRELANQTFDELIRQITISQPERGLLLLRVRDELNMTLLAYQDLFVSARDYDPYKNVLKESFTHQTEMETKLESLTSIMKQLEEERDSLVKILETEDAIFKEKREYSLKKHNEEFQFLKRVNNVLKQHIEAMLDPNNNIDPFIHAFDSHPKPKDSRQRKGRKNKCK